MPTPSPASPPSVPVGSTPTQPSGLDKAFAGLRSLASLQIVTVVSEPTKVKGSIDKVEIGLDLEGNEANTIATSINIVTGDITNVVPEQFWAPDKKEALEFHLAQVKEASAIISNNIKIIADYGEKLAKSLKKLGSGS